MASATDPRSGVYSVGQNVTHVEPATLSEGFRINRDMVGEGNHLQGELRVGSKPCRETTVGCLKQVKVQTVLIIFKMDLEEEVSIGNEV